MRLKVTYLNGTSTELTAGAAAKTALERRVGHIWFACFNAPAEGQPDLRREEYLHYLAWRSIPADDRPDDFDGWLEDVADTELVDADDEPDPTRTVAGSEVSST